MSPLKKATKKSQINTLMAWLSQEKIYFFSLSHINKQILTFIDKSHRILLSFHVFLIKHLHFFIKYGNVPLIYTLAFYKIKANRNQKRHPIP